MNQDNITDRVSLIISELTDYAENRIDVLLNSNIIQPYIGSDDIRLIIIGQDPTVKNINSRKKIETTLNLDKKNALASYISRICNGLGLSLSNVYATNLFKYFYTNPPASTMNVLYNHIQPNLELLREELNAYPSCPIITLGEPLLKLLTNKDERLINYLVKHYAGKYTRMIVGTGDVASTVGFYKSCGYEYSHRIENFFTDNYDYQILEDGVLLKDMIYLKQEL
nr:uracil-DNA glycosylase family protein [Bacteroides sp. 41_26]